MRTAFALVAAAGLAATAVAQDSVSSTGNGDGLNAYAGAEAVVDYVVDLTPFATSWGTEFGIAPIIKATDSDGVGGFSGSLISSQFISQDTLFGVSAVNEAFSFWQATAGAGVNPTQNTSVNPIMAPASVNQQGVVFGEFSGNYNGVVGGLVAFDPEVPGRLYVRRVTTAINGASNADNSSQLGSGSVDANGNAYYRADQGFGDTATFGNDVTGNNLFRTDLSARTSSSNEISGGFAGIQATDVLLSGSTTTHLTPNNVPQSVAGGSGVIATANFNSQYVAGGVAAVPNGNLLANGNADNRGSLGATTATPLGGDYTFAITQESPADIGQESIGVFAVDTAGNMLMPTLIDLDLPASISDPDTGYTVTTVNGGGLGEFEGHSSQTSFRGGNGQIAVHEDTNGDLIVAGNVYDIITAGDIANDSPYNALVVARRDAAGNTEWVVAAHSSDNAANLSAGKEILDGPGGNVIGRLALLLEVTGGSPLGPSISQPAFDSAGNIWFIGAVALDRVDTMGNSFVDFDSALIRAVYNPDSFTYELELVVELGQEFTGVNSGVAYQITFMGIADNNSISSGTMFSGNVSKDSYNGFTGLDPVDSRTNGGVVMNAEITYDTNNDGDFDDTLGDESYGALMYIGNLNPEEPPMGCNAADIALPFGILDLSDIDAFIAAFATSDPVADIAAPFGVIDLSDIDAFIGAFLAGCP
ncbi:MAG: GC-type dockerin domain-anchored protein [Planctomycetota bacterium]